MANTRAIIGLVTAVVLLACGGTALAAKVERPFEADAWGKLRSRSCAEAGWISYILRDEVIYQCVLSEGWCAPLANYVVEGKQFAELPPAGQRTIFLPLVEPGHGVPWTIINRKIIRFMTKRFPPAAYKRCSEENTRKLLSVLADSYPDALSEADRKLLAGE